MLRPVGCERTRVAAVIGNLNEEHGGAQQLLYDVFSHLPDEFDLVVYHMFGPGTFRREFEKEGVSVHHLGARSNADLRALARLIRRLRRDRPDVLQTNSPISGIWGRVAAKAARVPCVVSVEHSLHDAYRLLPRLTNGLTLPLADVVVGVSEAVSDSLCPWERALLAPGTVVATIVNGINVDHFAPRKEAGSGSGEVPDERVVGTLGRLTGAKGLEHAIRAWPRVIERVPGARLRLVGDGPCREALETLVAELGVGQTVTFAGYRPDPLPELRGFDVAVFPSLWEGLPLSLLQAMATGVPVVGSDIRPVQAVIANAGVTVPPKDEDALADALIALLQSPDRRTELAKAGRERVRCHFSVDRTAARYAELYRECAAP